MCRYAAELLRSVPGIRLFESPQEELQTGVLSLQIGDLDCEDAARRLGEQGVAVRAGLHCAPLAHRTAGTLERGTVRLSFSHFTTEREVEKAAEIIAGLR